MFLLDFFGSQAGAELLRIIDSVVGILAAILSGAALRNVLAVRKTVGGLLGRTLPQVIRGWFHPSKHADDVPPDVKRDAFQSLTLAQKVDMLKDNQETLALRQGVDSEQIHNRLDRVDPLTRRH